MEETSAALRVWVLGPWQLELPDGSKPDMEGMLRRTHAVSLFKLLLLAPSRSISRTQVMEALWPGQSYEPGGSLDACKSELARALEHLCHLPLMPRVTGEPPRYRLLAEQRVLWTDLMACETIIHQAIACKEPAESLKWWEQAYRFLQRGEVLAEDQHAYWYHHPLVQHTCKKVRQYRTRCVLRIADLCLARRQMTHAQHLLADAFEHDPTNEEIGFFLIDLLGKVGKIEEALFYSSHLEEALLAQGISPRKETMQLERHLRSTQITRQIWVIPDEEESTLSITGRKADAPPLQVLWQNTIRTPPKPEGDEMDLLRRQLLHQAVGGLGTAVLPSHFLFSLESWERLSHVLDNHRPSSLDETTLDELGMILETYWRLFYSSASPDLLYGTLGLLQTLTSLLHYSYPAALEQRLCLLAGGASLLAGKIALDQAHYPIVDGYYRTALQAAQKAKDQTFIAIVFARIASALVEKKQPQQAIPYFQEARRLCDSGSFVSQSAWLCVHEAETWAMMHQEDSCRKALEGAQRQSHAIPSAHDPYWTGFDQALFFGFQGICFLKLDRPQEASQALRTALTLVSPPSSRQAAIFLTDLASLCVQTKEIEEACNLTADALHLAIATKSARVVQRLLHVRTALKPWDQERCVKQLDEQLLTLSIPLDGKNQIIG